MCPKNKRKPFIDISKFPVEKVEYSKAKPLKPFTKAEQEAWNNAPYNPEDWYFMWDEPSPRWIKEQEGKDSDERKGE